MRSPPPTTAPTTQYTLLTANGAMNFIGRITNGSGGEMNNANNIAAQTLMIDDERPGRNRTFGIGAVRSERGRTARLPHPAGREDRLDGGDEGLRRRAGGTRSRR